MTYLKLLLTAGPMLVFCAACGDDASPADPSDTETEVLGSDETDQESDGTDDAGDAEDAGDAGDTVDGLDACADFLGTSWDRIRECESDLASILPNNALAPAICGMYCDPGDATVPRETFDACRTTAENLQCEDIPSDVASILSNIPEECTFLTDSLNCQFPEI